MKHGLLSIAVVAGAVATFSTPSTAQNQPRLHVNPRWKQCSIQLDPSLKQSAWHQFTQEAGQVVYFRPLVDAQPMGRGNFEFSLMQWQTNVDDNTSAWNDTFVHPDSAHWLYEGSGLQFPGFAARAGVASRTDIGVYLTKNFQANYGAYGLQLQQNLVGGGGGDWDVSARASFVSLFGPEDVDLRTYGVDVVTSWKRFKLGRITLSPYAGVATYLSSSHEKSPVVRVSAEASVGRLPSIALKVGVGR
jgi:hypothetical protein